jgi:hypothetical protein
MARTFLEVQHRVEDLKLRRAVWTEMYSYMGKYTTIEAVGPDYAIKTNDCITPVVPPQLIEKVLADILAREIEPLTEEIDELQNLTVEETNHGEERKEAKGKEPDRKLAKEVSKKDPKPGKNGSSHKPVSKASEPVNGEGDSPVPSAGDDLPEPDGTGEVGGEA